MSQELRQEETKRHPLRRDLSEEAHEELLTLALRATSRGEEAAEAKAELHEAIRKAHQGGASIRAIALAAALSTTRVGVIVNEEAKA